MADAVSRSSERLGCVNVVPGAGLTHALSGIAEAYLDGIAMLVLGCGIRRDAQAKAYQLHDVDQTSMVRPVTKAQLRPGRGSEIYATIRHACRIARTPPAGPVFVEIPVDQHLFQHEPGIDDWTAPTSQAPAKPDREALAEVHELLARSRHPLLYLGLGAEGAGEDLVALAERLEAPVATTIQGKGVFPESHPLWLWCGFGQSAPAFVRKVAKASDLTLAIGCRFSEVGTGSYGIEPPTPLIHIDIDEEVLGRNFPAEASMVADAATFVAALLETLEQRDLDTRLRGNIEQGHEKVAAEQLVTSGHGVAPALLLRSLQDIYGPSTVFTTDSGNGTFLAMEILRLDRARAFLAPVDYSCMGYSVPAALGAALACPDRRAVALAGDGAFLMTGLELLTAGQLQLSVTVIVLRDHELAQISQFQKTALARKTASQLPDFDLAALSQAMDVEYLSLSQDGEIDPVLHRAKETHDAGRPVLVEVAIDYSKATYFTRGVVKTNLGRLPWLDRLRFISRAVGRRLTQRDG
jgi:acetolactate synthase-1/2/3 large subunit